MTVRSQIEAVADLSAETRARMLALMVDCYLDVRAEEFARDLAEKDWVVLLVDPALPREEQLVGFSTLVQFPHLHRGQRIRIAFSGDTVIRPSAWGSQALPIGFGNLLKSIRERHPLDPLYWMLISKGFRTYRFLPVFFLDFYPRWDRTTPVRTRELMDELGRLRFGDGYDSETGLVFAGDAAQRLRPSFGQPRNRVIEDPHVRYFLDRNPHWERGDELLCLARFDPDNLRPFIRRRLYAHPGPPVLRNPVP